MRMITPLILCILVTFAFSSPVNNRNERASGDVAVPVSWASEHSGGGPESTGSAGLGIALPMLPTLSLGRKKRDITDVNEMGPGGGAAFGLDLPKLSDLITLGRKRRQASFDEIKLTVPLYQTTASPVVDTATKSGDVEAPMSI